MKTLDLKPVTQKSTDSHLNSKKTVILTFISYFLPGYKAGGIVRTISNTADHLSDEFEFWIVTRDRDLGDKQSYSGIEVNQWKKMGEIMIYYLPSNSGSVKNIIRLISTTPHDILYLNSFFDPICALKVLLARKLNLIRSKPVILAPRGELSSGSLHIKYQKKVIFICLAKLVGLYDNLVWHASNQDEANDFIKIMGVDPEAVHIALDLPSKSVSAEIPVENSFNEGITKIIFLSRISREKNLDFALNVLKKVKSNIVFDIFGPIEDEVYWKECNAIIKLLPRNIQVNFCGGVKPDKVIETFSRYSLFFFPTSGESYGHVIAESLTAGTPVLISDRTPWKALAKDDLGWEVPLNKESIFVDIIERVSSEARIDYKEKRNKVKKEAIIRLLDPSVLMANRSLFEKQIKS